MNLGIWLGIRVPVDQSIDVSRGDVSAVFGTQEVLEKNFQAKGKICTASTRQFEIPVGFSADNQIVGRRETVHLRQERLLRIYNLSKIPLTRGLNGSLEH